MIFSYSSYSIEMIPLLKQSKRLPQGFSDYFFGTPLMANILIDGKQLGSGELILGSDSSVYLLNLLDVSESQFNDKERELWRERLGNKLLLGKCNIDCPANILMVYYSLENSQLSILTDEVELQNTNENYRSLPEENLGVLIRNQLRLVSGKKIKLVF